MPNPPWLGLSLMPTGEHRLGMLRHLTEEAIDLLEWTVDFDTHPVPAWVDALLEVFGSQDRLVGHCVHLSLCTAGEAPGEPEWWHTLSASLAKRQYRYLTAHWGWATAANLVQSAPLPPPPGADRYARDRLLRLADVSGRPVGVENLALLLHPDDAAHQGERLAWLLDQVDGGLLLDVHNLYCQAVNLGVPLLDLAERYPLHRVWQLHLAGGHDDHRFSPPFRRDTHDDAIPQAVLDAVPALLARCPALQTVVFERLPGATPDAIQQGLDRTRAMCIEVEAVPTSPPTPWAPVEVPDLRRHQDALLSALHTGQALPPCDEPFGAWVSGFDARGVQVARDVVKRFGRTAD